MFPLRFSLEQMLNPLSLHSSLPSMIITLFFPGISFTEFRIKLLISLIFLNRDIKGGGDSLHEIQLILGNFSTEQYKIQKLYNNVQFLLLLQLLIDGLANCKILTAVSDVRFLSLILPLSILSWDTYRDKYPQTSPYT